jgi:2-polyprenyl-6-hydroxyphenyl methylase/3-demethylubiquinone-9 3-methyltransferase
MDTTSEINNAIYESYGDRWYTAYDDPIALLRAENKVKTPWILREISHYLGESAEILDVGCGGGFLSNDLAIAGHRVTGIDLSAESLKVAARFDRTKSVQYEVADAYTLPYPDQSFDAVTAMDFLEHVENPGAVIDEMSRVLRPGGLFFFHTFNRNFLSWLVVIKLVEWLVANTPKDMHVLRLFIKPEELERYCASNGLRVIKMTGLRPVISSIPLLSFFKGIVPEKLRFTLTKSLGLSYMGMAKKEGA